MSINENYINGEWIISSKREVFYNDNKDILERMNYTWQDEIYAITGRQVYTYNEDYLVTSMRTYLVNKVGVQNNTRLREWIYDTESILIQFRDCESENEVLTLTNQTDYIYENGLILQKVGSRYTATDTFQGREDFVHLNEGLYEGYKYTKNPGLNWMLDSKTRFYETPKVIGNLADSTFIFQYDNFVDSLHLITK